MTEHNELTKTVYTIQNSALPKISNVISLQPSYKLEINNNNSLKLKTRIDRHGMKIE